jgi:2-polyprenyl-6-methoxyphenol hydroxylase-like FAD-dependent oxidoreductase
MLQTDIAIAGGGLAGSMAAAMLGRAGFRAALIDPHKVYPPDFRCEKLDGSQVRLLQQTGLAEAILPAMTPDEEVWIARYGRLVEKRRNDQYDILYDSLVNTVRAQIPPDIAFHHAKVTAIAPGPGRQSVTLSTGEELSARLVILANGLNIGLRQSVGIGREIVSTAHSISIGFDLKPAGRAGFDFQALTYYPERAADRMAYLTVFPIGSTMRANLFVYRDMSDPWLRTLREQPVETLFAMMPGLRKLTGEIEIPDFIKIRPVDLYVSTGYRRSGAVLVGDAFATSCPAAGTGVNKVLADVVRLCTVHVPRWLQSEGMGEEKIAAFYDDAIKQACDDHSAAKAHYLRSLSTDAGFSWAARRWGRFVGQVGVGALRQARDRLSVRSADRPRAAAAGH